MVFIKNVYILNPVQSGDFEFFKGSLLVRDGKIQRIFRGETQPAPTELEKGFETEDCRFRYLVFPGFIQSHIHFCQTPHRNLAEEMPLMQWLKQEIWPFEGRHTPESIKRAALMSLKEVLRSGTTAVLDMGTVHHQEAIFELMAQTGFRYTGGKAMMDRCEGAPDSLAETAAQSIDQSMKLYETWHGKNKGLLRYAFAPRFVLSCSTELLQEVRRLSDQHNIIIHTHASEHPEEVAAIKKSYGHGNIAYLDKLGALNRNTVIAHMIHLEPHEKQMVLDYDISVAHCPSTNLKLGSGVAPVAEYLERGVRVGLGCDGAPCNNSLSIFNELRLAPLLQKGMNHDPLLVPAQEALKLVSLSGAAILRQEKQVGQIREGMDADLVLLDMDTPQTLNFQQNPAAAIVYGADARNVYATMVRGKFLYKNGQFSNDITNLESKISRAPNP